MIEDSNRIQSMLSNILEQVTIIRNDFMYNGQTHYNYILEKLERAEWDLNVLLKMARDEKEKCEKASQDA